MRLVSNSQRCFCLESRVSELTGHSPTPCLVAMLPGSRKSLSHQHVQNSTAACSGKNLRCVHCFSTMVMKFINFLMELTTADIYVAGYFPIFYSYGDYISLNTHRIKPSQLGRCLNVWSAYRKTVRTRVQIPRTLINAAQVWWPARIPVLGRQIQEGPRNNLTSKASTIRELLFQPRVLCPQWVKENQTSDV